MRNCATSRRQLAAASRGTSLRRSRGYVTAEQEFLDAVAEGTRDVKAGRITPHRKVVAEFERRRRSR